jgi:hypothetical protein
MRAWLLVLALAATASEAAAQRLRPGLGASVVTARARSELPGGTDEFGGTVVGGEGGLTFGRLILGFNYVQGSVVPVGGAGATRDLIEGGVQVGFRPLRWLTLGGGPQARAYVFEGRSLRWVFWEACLRIESAFIGSAVRGYVEGWRALAAEVNVPEAFDYAHGGESGIVVQLSRVPVQARVAYRIDRAVLGAGARIETVEGVVVSLALGRR